ncbi:DUF3710 domain-containing protein [Streptomyces sp. BE230]|uniref:DUF3710 domain-containing protein n=1 Tax=Streptomyces sp. BE230 TaxID=3002526 RepID=UPI002ED1FACF|nr:DUF3710 domain-containing protein [Streptomyces sp. BE230]
MARAVRESELLSLGRVLDLLVYVITDEVMTSEDIDLLLESAQEMSDESLQAEDLLRPSHRGTDFGPWDIGETGWQGVDLLDFGGLKVPRGDVSRVELNQLRSREEYGEVVLFRDATASLQLQAFRVPGEPEWESVLVGLESNVRARGGEAERWSGRVGIELRATVPVFNSIHGRDAAKVRFIGCDGPGWLLRGVVGGGVASNESRDEWAYHCFENVVVSPSFEIYSPTVPVLPAHHFSSEPQSMGQVIPLIFPEGSS